MFKRFFLPLFIVVLAAFFYLSYLNPKPFTVILAKGKAPIQITVSKIFLLSFVLGFLLSFLYFVVVSASRKRAFSKERRLLLSRLEAKRAAAEVLCGYLMGRDNALEEIEKTSKEGRSYLSSALILWKEGRFKEAFEVLRGKEEELSSTPCGSSLYALSLYGSGDINGAMAFLERVTVKGKLSEDPFVLRVLRDLYIKAGRFEDALSLARKIHKSTKDKRDEMAVVGIEYEILKGRLKDDPKSVVKGASKIFKSHPGFLPAYLLAADAYEAMGKDGKEKELFGRLMKDVGPNPEVLKFVEAYYMKKGNPDRILDIYRKALASSDDDPDILFLYGELCESLEMLDEALEAYRRIKSKGMSSYFLSLREVLLLKRMGKDDEALKVFEEVSPELERSFFPYFECEVCGGRSEEWRDFCDRCLSWGSFRFRSRIRSSLQ